MPPPPDRARLTEAGAMNGLGIGRLTVPATPNDRPDTELYAS